MTEPVVLLAVLVGAASGVALSFVPIVDRTFERILGPYFPKRYKIVQHEKTEWGTLFAIVSPNGEIVGVDRYKPAKERCAALNASAQRP